MKTKDEQPARSRKKKENIENMKTRISQLAAITLFAILFLVGNVNAKGTEKSASSHENIEATLELENWMVNDSYWETGTAIFIEQAIEENMELENWMINKNTWNVNNPVNLKTETEQELVLESWMTNENIWNR